MSGPSCGRSAGGTLVHFVTAKKGPYLCNPVVTASRSVSTLLPNCCPPGEPQALNISCLIYSLRGFVAVCVWFWVSDLFLPRTEGCLRNLSWVLFPCSASCVKLAGRVHGPVCFHVEGAPS